MQMLLLCGLGEAVKGNLRSQSYAQMLPFLGPVLGRGKLGNFLIRNKWRNYDAIKKLQHVPMLMLSAGQVCAISVKTGAIYYCTLVTARFTFIELFGQHTSAPACNAGAGVRQTVWATQMIMPAAQYVSPPHPPTW